MRLLSMPFGAAEHRILSYFERGTKFMYRGRQVTVEESGKPSSSSGEPKTDIYVLVDGYGGTDEIKISYKKINADFLENKIGKDRAVQLFGPAWSDIIRNSTECIENQFLDRYLIYKKRFHGARKGSITLGWRFELLNVKNGDLSDRLDLDLDQVYDVYAGENLSEDKRNAYVNGRRVPGSGVANNLLMIDQVFSAQDIVNNMISIDEYVDSHPNLFFACKALNYRTFEKKIEGNRPLAVQVDWYVDKGKLTPELDFENPLERKGYEMRDQLLRSLAYLNISTTDDINAANADRRIIFD